LIKVKKGVPGVVALLLQYWRVDGGKMEEKWKWRLDEDVKGFKTW